MDIENKINEILIYDNNVEIEFSADDKTFWLSLNQISELFERDKSVISRHIKNILKTGEVEEYSTVAKNATVQLEGNRKIAREIEYYNLDIIIAVGYRVNSSKGTKFRIWATKILNNYLVQGYAINEKRLKQKNQEIQHLKTGIRILNRAIETENQTSNNEMLNIFSKGLELLDNYDHEELDSKGQTIKNVIYPSYDDYLNLIEKMYSEFKSDVFAKPKDDSFKSSINQIAQGFGDSDIYPTLEEKAAMLLYLITKNHSFVDGNKRIAAACFLYFLEKNDMLIDNEGNKIIGNEALATLTLFIASSKSQEMKTVKNLIITVLNN